MESVNDYRYRLMRELGIVAPSKKNQVNFVQSNAENRNTRKYTSQPTVPSRPA